MNSLRAGITLPGNPTIEARVATPPRVEEDTILADPGDDLTGCSVEGCNRPHEARGFCASHYGRLRRHGDVMADVPVRDRSRSPEQRFWEKVDRGEATECWEWKACRLPTGYGKFSLNGRIVPAHRFAYEFLVGPIPARLLVCHRCDNPSCCNPAHLFLGTHSDNAYDSVAKDRHFLQKLTSAQVRTIRARYQGKRGEVVALAQEFGVDRGTIWRALYRRRV